MQRRDFLKMAAAAAGGGAGALGTGAWEELHHIPELLSACETRVMGLERERQDLISSYVSKIDELEEELVNTVKVPEPPEPHPAPTDYTVASYMMTRWGMRTKTRGHDWNYGLSLHPSFQYRADNPLHNDWLIYIGSLYGVNAWIVDVSTANPAGHPWDEDGTVGLEKGLMKATYFPRMKFAVEFNNMMYWPGNQWGYDPSLLRSKTEEAITYMIENHYFEFPNYLRKDGKPLFFFGALGQYHAEHGVTECCRMIDMVRNILESNGTDVFLVGDIADYLQETEAVKKLDGVAGYYTNSWGLMAARDRETLFEKKNADGSTINMAPFTALVEGSIRCYKFWKKVCDKERVAFIPPMSPTGFCNRAAYEEGIDSWGMLEFSSPTPQEFDLVCKSAKQSVDPELKMVTIVGNDYVEGAAGGEVTLEYGDSFLRVLRGTFVEEGPIPYGFSFVPVIENT
jgi:hypothetical protein